MKEIFQTGQFRKDLKRMTKRGNNLHKLKQIVRARAEDAPLDSRLRDHALAGRWTGSRDCHIEPDWVLIYRINDESLFLERTGSHSDLFK